MQKELKDDIGSNRPSLDVVIQMAFQGLARPQFYISELKRIRTDYFYKLKLWFLTGESPHSG